MIEFTLPDQNGEPISLTDFRGKYVLVNFWASWCTPCHEENFNVLGIYNRYRNTDCFEVIGVNIDRNEMHWKQSIKTNGMTWPQVRDKANDLNIILRHYGINSILSSFLLDPTGIIIARNLRGSKLEAKLVEIFKTKGF